MVFGLVSSKCPLLKVAGPSLLRQSARGKMRPPFRRPYRALYRTDGEQVKQNEVLVVQGDKLNYHPGLNVYHRSRGFDKELRAMVPGTVMITTELVNLDWDMPEVIRSYERRRNMPLRKLTYNVIPPREVGRFRLVDTT